MVLESCRGCKNKEWRRVSWIACDPAGGLISWGLRNGAARLRASTYGRGDRGTRTEYNKGHRYRARREGTDESCLRPDWPKRDLSDSRIVSTDRRLTYPAGAYERSSSSETTTG